VQLVLEVVTSTHLQRPVDAAGFVQRVRGCELRSGRLCRYRVVRVVSHVLRRVRLLEHLVPQRVRFGRFVVLSVAPEGQRHMRGVRERMHEPPEHGRG
jgi:hypothetical protein